MRARDYKERVELFIRTEVEDLAGYVTSTFVSLGTFPAAVRVLSGQRAMYYQSLGYTHPIEIEMRYVAEQIVKVKWNNYEIVVRSLVRSDHAEEVSGRDKGRYMTIEGAYQEVTTTTSTTTTTIG